MLRHIYKTFLVTLFVSLIPVFVSAQVISEIYYLTTSKQWVEVYNNTSNSLDLTQYKILDAGAAVNGHGVTLCSSSLQPNAYAVIAKVPEDFTASSFVVCKSALGVKTTTDDTVVLKLGSSVVDTVLVALGSTSGSNSLQLQGDHTWVGAIPTPGFPNTSSSNATSTGSDTDGSSTTTQTTNTNSTPVASSAHYSAVPLSPKKEEEPILLSAGRERLGVVGSPLEFRVETSLANSRNTNFKWNFGDGTVAYGDRVEHAYEYAGDYAVVLNTSTLSGAAVARTNVRIISPDLVITEASPEKIAIKNNSTEEISLFGRALWVGGKIFLFPQDTIIKSGESISFSHHATNLYPSNLNEVQMIVTGSVEEPQMELRIAEEKLVRITRIQNQLAKLKQQMAHMSVSPQSAVSTSTESVEPTTQTANAKMSLPASSANSSHWLKTLKTFILRTNNE